MNLKKRFTLLSLAVAIGLFWIVPSYGQTFSSTGSMTVPRENFTATLLNSGLVLIAGGIDNGLYLASAELYNPANGTFTPTGEMETPREWHSATLLNNGMVLIAGGYNNSGTLSSAELYNPSTGTFSSTGSLISARDYATATLLNNGMVLVAGGRTGVNEIYLLTAELYNPATAAFTATGSEKYVHLEGTATLLNNGEVLVAGGFNNASAELYNPASGAFSTTGNLNDKRYFHTATLLNNGNVLIVGGFDEVRALDTAELYNPSAGTFTLTGNLNDARYLHAATLMNDGQVLVAGGYDGPQSSAELYNPSTGTFALTGSLITARGRGTATILNTEFSNLVLVAGGEGSSSTLSSAEIYTGLAVTGIINPKYVILGVIYAPPGPQSNVEYTSSTFVGNTTTLNSSFSSETSLSVSIGAEIAGWGSMGKILGTSTTSYTETTGTTSTVTLSQTTSLSDKTTGTPNAFSPINHDYDQVVLWLNPVLEYTITPGSQIKVEWNGYGYDTCDQPAMDIYFVYVGYLNGDFGPNPSVAQVLARSWATNPNCPAQTWPSGEGPGLTATDLASVMAADPFSNPSYVFALAPGVSPATTTDGRFTIATANPIYNQVTDFPYVQCAPGGGACDSEMYSNGYTYTSTLGQTAMYQFKQAFGLQEQFSETAFGIGITGSVNQTQTLTWQNVWQNTITNTATETNELLIQGPSCTGSPCSPVYQGPGEFDAFQDNLYGSFAFIPAN